MTAKRFAYVFSWLLALALLAAPSAQAKYTVSVGSGGEFADLAAALDKVCKDTNYHADQTDFEIEFRANTGNTTTTYEFTGLNDYTFARSLKLTLLKPAFPVVIQVNQGTPYGFLRIGNTSMLPGGLFAADGITFRSNNAFVLLETSGQVKLTNCRFDCLQPLAVNTQVQISYGLNAEVTGCTFSGFRPSNARCLQLFAGNGSISGCTFTDSYCGIFGPAPWATPAVLPGINTSGHWTVTNCTFRDASTAATNARAFEYFGGNLTVSDCLLENIQEGLTYSNSYGHLKGTFVANNCTFRSAGGRAIVGAYPQGTDASVTGIAWDSDATITLTNCLLEATKTHNNGGVHVTSAATDASPDTRVTLKACKVINKNYSTETNTAGARVLNMGQLRLENTLIKDFYRGFYLSGTTVKPLKFEAYHCVIDRSGLAPLPAAGAMAGEVANNANISLTLKNSVVTAGLPKAITLTGDGTNLALLAVERNLMNPASGYVGNNAVTGDPGFINPGGDDYHIAATSAGRNRGEAVASTGVAVDVDGDARPLPASALPDLGLDEVDESVLPPSAVQHWMLY